MTIQDASYSRILAVWMLLFACLVWMVLPTAAFAREEMAIATAGDPTDGLDCGGGGGGGNSDDGNQSSTPPELEPRTDGDFSQLFSGYYRFFPKWENGILVIYLFRLPPNEFPKGISQ